jgi:hypothetical protein
VVEPAFRLQLLLRRTIVGKHFWSQREEKLRRRFNAVQRDADAKGINADWCVWIDMLIWRISPVLI